MRVVKPDSYRTICAVDTDALCARVMALGEGAWNAEDSRKENRFSCFHHTRHIIARFIPSNHDPMTFYATPFWTVWEPLLRPILDQVAAQYELAVPEFPKVMFARLAAGAVIDRHVDGNGSNLVTHKIHVPLVTNPGVVFEVAGEVFHLVPGHAYELNNIRPHAVRNEGDADRIHLIFELFDRALHEGPVAA